MNADEQTRILKEFLEKFYYPPLLEAVRKGENFLRIDFMELAKFSPEIVEELLEHPEEIVKAGENAVKEFDLSHSISRFYLRFFNLPESQKIRLSDIRSKHLGKFFWTEGAVRTKSEVRPHVMEAKFECPSCGSIISKLQDSKSYTEPSRCACGRKGKFKEVSKELVDGQGLTLEESPEDLEGGEQPKRLHVFLKNDLVSPINERRASPGTKVRVVGWVGEVPITLRTGGQSTKFDLLIEANNVDTVDEDFYMVKVTEEEEKAIKELAEDPHSYERLIHSLAPSIYGHEKVKEALVLQLAGGVKKERPDGVTIRGDSHILLIGDPGSGKSQILKRIGKIAPKGRYTSGKGVSAAGLTASVVKDELLGGWSLEAGALVLANKGLCCTTGDSEFILENGKRMTFEELFKNKNQQKLTFKILALNNKTLTIEPFPIKHIIKIKNDKKIFRIKTRTGREINLTEDNEVLTAQNSKLSWMPIGRLSKDDFIAVPKRIPVNNQDKIDKDFAYLGGLIAADGHISLNRKHAHTSFYNTDMQLIKLFKEKMSLLGFTFSSTKQQKGRKSMIDGREITSKKDLYHIYNTRKIFAEKLIDFGVPSGNKSTGKSLDNKLSSYSNQTLCAFMRGIFDGDGSIRHNPTEIIITSGIRKNARLFQEILLQTGIISSIKRSTHSWHCSVRGTNNCLAWFEKIGTNHPAKLKRFMTINWYELKDRIDILPNHQEFFKDIIKKNRWKLGKKMFRYFWNYSRPNVAPSKHKLKELNMLLNDPGIRMHVESDILWDKIVSINETEAEFVYDFTMDGTNNFIANNTIMHNCIDEMDKMAREDTSALHEAMEQQTISISKANIQATLHAETTILAAANPKSGRFNPYDPPAQQLDPVAMPSTLLSRFDLIFPIKDLPDKTKDEKMATHILGMHQNPAEGKPELETKFLRKFFSYIRQHCQPQLTDGALKEIKDYYVQMRGMVQADGGGMRAVPITARQLEALTRLAEASAKLRLSPKVTKKDAQRAIDMIDYCLKEVAMDKETGVIDIDRISTDVSSSQRNKMMVVKEMLVKIEEEMGGNKQIEKEKLVSACAEKGIKSDELEKILELMHRSGEVFEPRRGVIQRL